MNSSINCSRIVFLQSAQVVIGNFEKQIDLFSENNVNYTPEYIEDIKNRVDNMYVSIGVITQLNQKQYTFDFTQISENIVNKLYQLCANIEICYKKDYETCQLILSNTGLLSFKKQKNKYAKKTLANIVNLCINTIEEYKTDLISKGINPQLFTEMNELGKQFLEIITIQHDQKGQSIKLTAEQQSELNDLYNDVMSICKIGKIINKSKPELRELYNFAGISRRFSSQGKSKSDIEISSATNYNTASLN